MKIRKLIKRASAPMPVLLVCGALLLLLSVMIVRLLTDETAGRLHFWITLIGMVGVVILVFFLVTNLYSLYRQYARNEVGSKLTVKLVSMFLLLTLIPFSMVYLFSIQFLNKGIDSWFDVRVEQAVQDAILLGQSSLEAIKQEVVSDVEGYAQNLASTHSRSALLRALDDIRDLDKNYSEVSVYSSDGRVLAFSSDDIDKLLPDTPDSDVFTDLRLKQTYTSLEPLSNNSQQLRVVTPIRINELGGTIHALQVIKLLPLRYGMLANSVDKALNQYDQMAYARAPLKFSLILALTLISLASLLFSILTAVYLSKLLVAPISNLVEGTKRIAEGDYGSKLPITSGDELGTLVGSFNDMSSKIDTSQKQIIRSQQETEAQKAYLETVLTNLSSGVFSFDENRCLQICNSAADNILGHTVSDYTGLTLEQLSEKLTTHAGLFDLIANGISSKQSSWQEEINLLGTHGRQMLIVRGSVLMANIENQENTVIVFDDVTNLIQAQRDAAWGEVARRLAHEIKNPLTPIQLSAERIQRKFSSQVSAELQPILERSTRTIIQQVESMKEMVNDFSTYAQPVRAKLRSLNVNQLLRDVFELHSSNSNLVKLQLELDDNLPEIKANSSALRQVFNNLVINALHALEEQKEGTITVRSFKAENMGGNYIDIQIEDNGIGIPHDIRDALFDPYVSSKAKGSGLGLAIVKRIVEEHSGSVWVEDARQSTTGACFNLRLPINAMQTYRGNRRQNTLKSPL